MKMISIILALFLTVGCATLTPEQKEDERWRRMLAREHHERMVTQCTAGGGTWVDTQFGARMDGKCMSRREFRDLMDSMRTY